MYVFFFITIIISLLIGFIFRKKYKIKYFLESENPSIVISLAIIVLGHICQFIYVGRIPALEQIRKTGYMYVDFKGIPTFHVLLLTFNSYYCVYLSFLFFKLKKKRYLIGFFISIFMIGLLYNRGMIIMILFMSFIIYFSQAKMTKKLLISSFIFVTLVLYGFGVFGNIRHGYRWDDTRYLGEIAKIQKDLGKLNPFFWSYIYISSPLANLQYNINNIEPSYSFQKLIMVNVVPDFIKKRIELKETKGELIVKNLTVSSGFLPQYLEGGIVGMYLLFVIFTTFNIIYTFLLRSDSLNYIIGISILCCVVTFSFFVNMYTFSGLSFQLIYPLIFGILSKIKILKKTKGKIINETF